MMWMRSYLVLLFACLATCIGCGAPSATVQGTVTIDGQLAHNGTVVFHPVKDGPTAYGTIGDNGSYAVRVGKGDLKDPNSGDVPPGEYVVTVVVNMPSTKDESVGPAGPPTPGPRLTAAKYADASSSGLRTTVKSGTNIVPLELQGAGDDPPPTTNTEPGGAGKELKSTTKANKSEGDSAKAAPAAAALPQAGSEKPKP